MSEIGVRVAYTETFSVTSDDDNAYGQLNGTFATNTIRVYAYPGGNVGRSRGVFRWENVTIPVGSWINSVTISATVGSISQSDLYCTVGFEATPNGADFATRNTAAELWAITRTSTVSWRQDYSIGDGAVPPELRTQFLETGWTPGDTIIAVLEGAEDITEACAFRSFGSGGVPGKLTIDYEAPSSHFHHKFLNQRRRVAVRR